MGGLCQSGNSETEFAIGPRQQSRTLSFQASAQLSYIDGIFDFSVEIHAGPRYEAR
jgi:hypothetical protein